MNRKYYYYVGVLGQSINDDELQFVYEIDDKHALYGTYNWLCENGKKPLLFSKKESANNLSRGLCMNFCFSVVITSFIELK